MSAMLLALAVVAVLGLVVVALVATLVPALWRARAAQQEAVGHAREELLKAQESALQVRSAVESELRDRQTDVVRREVAAAAQEAALAEHEAATHVLAQDIERASAALRDRESSLAEKEANVEAELARVAKMDREKASRELGARLEAQMREALAARAKSIEAEAQERAETRARDILVTAMQRAALEYISEATVSVVELPSEDMKGRIIGREGRNIRSFEQITGVDLVIDDTPEAVVISSFDPVRREIARLTLMNLMLDGRIHPARIEELFEKARSEVDRTILDAARRALDAAHLGTVSPDLAAMLGRLRFRTSYAQNVLDHSVEVSRLAAAMASELGLNVEVAKRAGLLHDIGKALGPDHEGPHAEIGAAFLRAQGETDAVVHAVEAHHEGVEAAQPEAVLVMLADSLSATRPGARKENLENYVKRMTALEALAASFPGVERCYAVQAGREIRLIVKPSEIDDAAAARLAGEVARKIEQDLEFPGQIKVTVIREVRVQDMAR